MPTDPALRDVVVALNAAFDSDQASFTWGKLVTPSDGPGEDSHKRGICYDATKDGGTEPIANATCDCNGAPCPSLRKWPGTPPPFLEWKVQRAGLLELGARGIFLGRVDAAHVEGRVSRLSL
jgi:hypothetical protein